MPGCFGSGDCDVVLFAGVAGFIFSFPAAHACKRRSVLRFRVLVHWRVMTVPPPFEPQERLSGLLSPAVSGTHDFCPAYTGRIAT